MILSTLSSVSSLIIDIYNWYLELWLHSFLFSGVAAVGSRHFRSLHRLEVAAAAGPSSQIDIVHTARPVCHTAVSSSRIIPSSSDIIWRVHPSASPFSTGRFLPLQHQFDAASRDWRSPRNPREGHGFLRIRKKIDFPLLCYVHLLSDCTISVSYVNFILDYKYRLNLTF